MTPKYHIGKDGTPKEYRAKTRPCTLGNHFNNFDEAKKYADNLNENHILNNQLSINNLVKQKSFREKFNKWQLKIIDYRIKQV